MTTTPVFKPYWGVAGGGGVRGGLLPLKCPSCIVKHFLGHSILPPVPLLLALSPCSTEPGLRSCEKTSLQKHQFGCFWPQKLGAPTQNSWKLGHALLDVAGIPMAAQFLGWLTRWVSDGPETPGSASPFPALSELSHKANSPRRPRQLPRAPTTSAEDHSQVSSRASKILPISPPNRLPLTRHWPEPGHMTGPGNGSI